MVALLSSSKSTVALRAAMKNVFADRREGCVADGRLCRRRVAVKMFIFVIS